MREFQQRFIPAGAGNTFHTHAQANARSVHPRWRGEHTCACRVGGTSFGSSPLARGTPGVRRSYAAEGRFIPAGAGNTLSLTNCSLKEKISR